MGRILPFRSRRARMPEFSEALAHLQEEITLTESFAGAMIRSGDYKAAIGAIDEQRERLAAAELTMLTAMRPRPRRVQVAAAGIAAIMMVGSASIAFVAFQPSEAVAGQQAIISQAGKKLELAASAKTQAQVTALVDGAIADLAQLGESAGSNPKIGDDFEGLQDSLTQLLVKRPNMRGLLAARIAQLKDRVDLEVPEPETSQQPPDKTLPSESPKASPGPAPSSSESSAPQPPDVSG